MRRYMLCWSVVFAVVASNGALADKVYRWVDQDGKVHYSQTKPDAAVTNERSFATTPAPTPDATPESQPERNQRGECLTIKCMADEMEADRLKRERGYAAQRAKNEQALKKKAETKAAPKTAAVPLNEHDKELQHNCKRGLYYGTNTKINCDDMDAVRAEWKRHYDAEMARRDHRLRHGNYGR